MQCNNVCYNEWVQVSAVRVAQPFLARANHNGWVNNSRETYVYPS